MVHTINHCRRNSFKIRCDYKQKMRLKTEFRICFERNAVIMLNTFSLANSQLLPLNPVIEQDAEKKRLYYKWLLKYVRITKLHRRRMLKAKLDAYKGMLTDNGEKQPMDKVNADTSIDALGSIRYLLVLDFIHIIGYDFQELKSNPTVCGRITNVINQIQHDLQLSKKVKQNLTDAILEGKSLQPLLEKKPFCDFPEYGKHLMQNSVFVSSGKPAAVLVTATMSAGKSTFINAITGKKICRTQNMACTSKIHTIISKPFEDGCITKYDGSLLMDASRDDLMENSEKNLKDVIFVSTYLQGELSGKQMILRDSPGVNASQNAEHKHLTERCIIKGEYDLLIFILNGEHLRTEDEERHLKFVLKHVPSDKIMFVVNKADNFYSSEEDLNATLSRQREYLNRLGFSNPLLYQVSDEDEFLAKTASKEELSRYDRRRMENECDKLEILDLPSYYKASPFRLKLPEIQDGSDAEMLLRYSGIPFVEKAIERRIENHR